MGVCVNKREREREKAMVVKKRAEGRKEAEEENKLARSGISVDLHLMSRFLSSW